MAEQILKARRIVLYAASRLRKAPTLTTLAVARGALRAALLILEKLDAQG